MWKKILIVCVLVLLVGCNQNKVCMTTKEFNDAMETGSDNGISFGCMKGCGVLKEKYNLTEIDCLSFSLYEEECS